MLTISKLIVVVACDDTGDQLILKELLEKIKAVEVLYFVNDGKELLDFLYHKEKYEDLKIYRTPDIIWYHLSSKIKDLEYIKEIKLNNDLKSIPLIVFADSIDSEENIKAYTVGVNSVIKIPSSLQDLKEVLEVLIKYWSEVVNLPSKS